MACFHPVSAFQPLAGGPLLFRERKDCKAIQIACGQCIGCRLQRSSSWALRIMHESKSHASNCFITLTYSDSHLPDNNSLRYSDFQLFFKRLRKKFGNGVRFYMCGEYGERFDRPHFHACIFGLDFDDKKVFSKSPSGHLIYTSDVLDNLWGKGFASTADLTFESAAYVARYVCKKVTGNNAESHYERVNVLTGELFSVVPEFAKMSLKPGIGASWLRKYESDVTSGDYIVYDGRKLRVPRYYDKLVNRGDELLTDSACKLRDEMVSIFREEMKFRRGEIASQFEADQSVERLRVKEEVVKARFSQLRKHI